MKYKAIAFDLDDTLIDTTNELIPFACRKIHSYLLTQGYPHDFQTFDVSRKEFVKTKSHKEFFKNLTSTFNVTSGVPISEVINHLNQLFYEPSIPEHLGFIVDAEDNLKKLSSKYRTYIVTAGVVAAQQRKLAQLKIDRYVKKENILIVAEGAYVTKMAAFEKIISDLKIRPEELLSIGNRLSQEIRMAKMLNCHTCYFQYGEHAEDQPQDKYENPDYTIHTHKELITKCQL